MERPARPIMVAFDAARGVLVVETAYNIHAYQYSRAVFDQGVDSGRYVFSGG
jgi:hypothetical protein